LCVSLGIDQRKQLAPIRSFGISCNRSCNEPGADLGRLTVLLTEMKHAIFVYEEITDSILPAIVKTRTSFDIDDHCYASIPLRDTQLPTRPNWLVRRFGNYLNVIGIRLRLSLPLNQIVAQRTCQSNRK